MTTFIALLCAGLTASLGAYFIASAFLDLEPGRFLVGLLLVLASAIALEKAVGK